MRSEVVADSYGLYYAWYSHSTKVLLFNCYSKYNTYTLILEINSPPFKLFSFVSNDRLIFSGVCRVWNIVSVKLKMFLVDISTLPGKALFSSLFAYMFERTKYVFLDENHKNNASRESWTFTNLTSLCGKEQNCSELSWVGTRCFRSEKGTAAKQQILNPITQNSWKCQPNVYCIFHHMTPFLLHNISKTKLQYQGSVKSVGWIMRDSFNILVLWNACIGSDWDYFLFQFDVAKHDVNFKKKVFCQSTRLFL